MSVLREETWDHVPPSKFLQGHVAPQKKSGNEKVHRKELCKKCEPQERNPGAPGFEERTQDETLQQERWDLARRVYKLKNTDKATLMGSAGTLSEKNRGARIRVRFRQDSYDGGHGQRRGANKRGSTSVRSRP